MKASPLLVSWHNDNAPIYSAHFQPHGKGRFATGGGDNNVRLWRIEVDGEERKVIYLTTLIKVFSTPLTVIFRYADISEAHPSSQCRPLFPQRYVDSIQYKSSHIIDRGRGNARYCWR